MLDGGWDFRPNVVADEVDELGAEIRLSPWWGGDPYLLQVGLELYGQAARRRPASGGDAVHDYGRASAALRVAAPLSGRSWRLGVELAGGTTFGESTSQRAWFIGGTRSLRGHAPSALWGPSFGRGRVEVARTYDIGTLSVFSRRRLGQLRGTAWPRWRRTRVGSIRPTSPDVPSPAPPLDHDGLLFGVGVGASLFDGLVRADVSYGLNGPSREFWIALYLDSLL